MNFKTSCRSRCYTMASALCCVLAASDCGSGGGSTGTGGSAGSQIGTGGSGGSQIGTGGSGAGGMVGVGGASPTGGTGGSTGGSEDAGTGGLDAGRDAGGGADGGLTNCAGNAISFGANDASSTVHSRVMADLMADLPTGNRNRTFEFWAFIRATDWVGEINTIYEYGDRVHPPNDPPGAAWGLDFGTNPVVGMAGNHATLDPYTNGGFDSDSTNNLGITSTMNQWVHLAMTWDGTAVRTYVNAVLRITTTGANGVTALVTLQTPLTIGCNNPRFSCFGGYIDELRVWNLARSANEIMTTYNKRLVGNEPGLVGYWRFDEAPGTTTAVDSVTSTPHTAHPGTLMATLPASNPTFVTPNPPAPILCN